MLHIYIIKHILYIVTIFIFFFYLTEFFFYRSSAFVLGTENKMIKVKLCRLVLSERNGLDDLGFF